jgi:LysM repeat protein
MPDYNPNQFVRAFAVIALVGALIAVAVVIATSGGSSDGGNDNGAQEKSEVTKRGSQAVDRGVWIVRSGDTLGHIAEETGIDVDTLDELNPKIDPQVLHEDQRIQLR